MTTETRTRHTREFVETLTGPAVYVVYFVIAYAATTLTCALAEGSSPLIADGSAATGNAVVFLTLAALAVLTPVTVHAARRLSPSGRKAEDDQDLFMAGLTLALALLSALAILWTGIAAMLVPGCT